MERMGDLPIMEEEFIWTTKDGGNLRLSEIGDGHLRNIERMMCREMVAAEQVGCMLQGEMAQIAMDGELSNMQHDYNAISIEISRRGLPLAGNGR